MKADPQNFPVWAGARGAHEVVGRPTACSSRETWWNGAGHIIISEMHCSCHTHGNIDCLPVPRVRNVHVQRSIIVVSTGASYGRVSGSRPETMRLRLRPRQQRSRVGARQNIRRTRTHAGILGSVQLCQRIIRLHGKFKEI